MVITNENYSNLIRGASLFGTGGGLPFKIQEKYFKELFEKEKQLEYYSIDQFDDQDIVVSISGMGPSNTTKTSITDMLILGINIFSETIGKPVSGIYECESNIEGVLFDVSTKSGYKVLDADRTGGRAIPQLFYSDLVLSGFSIFPMVVVDINKKSYIYKGTEFKTLHEYENELRRITHITSGPIAIVDHSLTIKDAKNILTCGILDRSFKFGTQLSEGGIEKVLKVNTILFHKEVEVTGSNLESDGKFYRGLVNLEDSQGNSYQIDILNENMILKKGNNNIHSFPQLIILYSQELNYSVHNTEISIGKKYHLIIIDSEEKWKGFDINTMNKLGSRGGLI